jgi:hypothetical protein
MFPRGPACPVCGAEVTGPPSAACPACGLPAAGQSGWVLGRIGATLEQLTRDRDELLATLRAAAPGRPGPAGPWAPPTAAPAAAPTAAPTAPAPPPPGMPWGPVPDVQPAPPRRRLSPQQVLLALGAVLLVAGALAFVALGWTRFGLVFQAAVMVVVTAAACGTSAWAARRALRATEEALAAAGTALLAVDLGAAHARGLVGLDGVPLRSWTAISCLVVVAVALGLGRLTRSTTTWPLAALLAAQPVPVLLLPGDLLAGPAGVAVALTVAALDLVIVLVLRRSVGKVARVLAAVWSAVGVLGGLALAGGGSPGDSWTATGLLLAAGAAAVVLLRFPRLAGRAPAVELVAAVAAAVAGLAGTGSLSTAGAAGPVIATAVGLLLLTAAALLSGARPVTGPLPASAAPAVRAALQAAGTTTAVVGTALLADADRSGALSLLALAATVPAALTALRLPRQRAVATGAALAAPVVAVLLAEEAGWLSAPTAGLLLALLAAGSFAVATLRTRQPEEWVCAGAGAVTGAVAGSVTGTVGAWGQVAVQLAVVGVAAGCYSLVAHRPLVAVAAVADLVLASWIAVGGAGIETPEAYTLPAAAGLLVVAWPRLRTGGPSWAAEGAAVGVALVPSALLVVSSSSVLRLVLVVAGAVALVAVGTLAHRQAPFVLGAGALAFIAATRLGRYAPLLPPWITLAAAGLVLLVLGATYERRLQQAREAVAWVAQMG